MHLIFFLSKKKIEKELNKINIKSFLMQMEIFFSYLIFILGFLNYFTKKTQKC